MIPLRRKKAIMARKVSLNISIDPELKKTASAVFKELGLDMTTAITLFLKQSVREYRIPFEITLNIPNQATLDALGEYEEMKNNPKKYPRHDSPEEALKSDDD